MKYLIRLLTTLNILVILALLVTGYSDRADAVAHPLISVMGLAFPVAAALNGLFLVLWTLIRWRRVWIPMLGFIACYAPMWTYCPLNRQTADVSEADSSRLLRVTTFNVGNPWTTDDLDTIQQYMEQSDADIICLQEFVPLQDRATELRKKIGHKYFGYTIISSSECIALFSRWPVISHHKIDIISKGNSAAVVILRVRDRNVGVVMCHLETNGLSREDKARFSSTVRGEVGMDDMRSESRTIVGKLMRAAQIRAAQTDSVVSYAHRILDKNTSVIVCGDFNDSPISPTRRKLTRELTDVYTAVGRGPGWTYRQHGINVRIDHIFCSPDLEPVSVSIDRNTTFSDHFPMTATLRMGD